MSALSRDYGDPGDCLVRVYSREFAARFFPLLFPIPAMLAISAPPHPPLIDTFVANKGIYAIQQTCRKAVNSLSKAFQQDCRQACRSLFQLFFSVPVNPRFLLFS